MAGLLAQAQQMQEKLLSAQNEIAAAEIVGSAGNGLVTVTGNGTGEVTAVSIDPQGRRPPKTWRPCRICCWARSPTCRRSVSSSPRRRWVRWPEASAAVSPPGSAADRARRAILPPTTPENPGTRCMKDRSKI